MKYHLLTIALLGMAAWSCSDHKSSNTNDHPNGDEQEKSAQQFQNRGHELVFQTVNKVGDYATLRKKKDVIYTYTYQTPDGKADVSTEKYLFDGELSYGFYQQHERTFPDLEGDIEQGYDGSEYWLKHNGTLLEDPDRLKRVAFNRPTNFYWFAMFQKLLDPGLNYEYLGEKTSEGINYDVVKVSFDSPDGKPTDIYQLYINKTTALTDQFLFTVADFGVMEPPYLMQLEYEKVDGMLIPSKRQYKKSTWDAEVSDAPWISVNWSDIKFDNGLSVEDFKK
jgi:hypothetical protein